MLRCPKCGTDNLLSAVFCRGCGDRLNLDEIKPDNFADIGDKKEKSNTKQNIIGGIILGVLVVGFLVGVLFPGCGKLDTTEEAQKAVFEKYKKVALRGATESFTDQEATDLANYFLSLHKGEAGSPPVKAITVRILEEKQMKALISSTVYGMPVTFTITNDITLDKGKVDLSMAGIRIGLFPLPEGFRSDMTSNAIGIFAECTKKFNRNIKSIDTEGGTIKATGRTRKTK